MNENGRCLHASCGLVSVMFIRQPRRERQREKERERYLTQVQTSPASLISVIDALMGVGGGGRRWTEEGRVQTRDFKGRLDAYQQNAPSSDTRGRSRWKELLMHLHLLRPPSSVHSAPSAADLRSQGDHGRRSSTEKQWRGVGEFLKFGERFHQWGADPSWVTSRNVQIRSNVLKFNGIPCSWLLSIKL